MRCLLCCFGGRVVVVCCLKTKPHGVQAGLKLTMYLRLTVLIPLASASQVPRLQTGLPCWGLSLGRCMPRKHFTGRATFPAVNHDFVRKCQPLSFLENYIYLLCACMCVGGPMLGGAHVEVRRPSWWFENL